MVDSANKQIQFTFTGASTHDSLYWQLCDGETDKQNMFTHIYSDTGT
ncbi:PKD domain-containing protein [Algoriphagus sp. D3-2-R+10]